ncbi:MAG TPA: amino acid adenylation domain-containing protein [Verrucomicrobiales bacterium]|nr:amino acid adenylation domain-containing protein [Verrucomicrobiales bacterium]
MVTMEQWIERLPEGESAPLSPVQERMWFLQEFLSRSYAYNSPIPFRVRGLLDHGLVARAIAEVVRRQEVLRTRFQRAEPCPLQVVDPAPDAFPVVFEEAADLNAAIGRVREEGKKTVDLESGPVLRVFLFRLGGRDDDHVLLLAMHHSSFDGWSCRLFVKEFLTAYEALHRGEDGRLGELRVRYRDVAAWQRKMLEDSAVREQVLGFWLKQLDGELPVLRLPTDRLRPSEFTHRGRVLRRMLPGELVSAAAVLAAQNRTTVFSVYLAAYFAFLHRYTGDEDMIVGVPSFGRRHPDLEEIIGVFVTTLPVRVRVDGSAPWATLLKAVRSTLLEAIWHDQIGFEQVLQALDLRRDPGTTPVFQTLCHLIDFPADPAANSGRALTVERVGYDLGSSQVDFAMLFERMGEGLELRAQYNPDLFEKATVERWLRHFQRILAQVCEDPDRPVRELDLLGEQDRTQMVVEWNRTERDWGAKPDVATRIGEVARRHPERTALRWKGREMSYGELDAAATRIARLLVHGGNPGLAVEERVGVLMERSPGMVAALLGILRAGGAYLPVDPSYPTERIRFLLEDGGVRTLLTDDASELLTEGIPARALPLDSWAGWTENTEKTGEGGEEFAALAPERLAYVIYTSGSTGRPKGVLVEHGALTNFIEQHASVTELGPADRVAMLSTLTFDISVEELWPSLCFGACVCLCEEEVKLSPPRLLDWFRREEVTVSHLPTPYTELLLAEDWPPEHRMRLFLTGGDRLHGYPRRRFPFRFLNTYGPTESTVTATWCEVPTGADQDGVPPIGRPVANMRVYVLDKNQTPVPPGVCGELYLAGKSLARGYLNREEETARRFVKNPFCESGGARMYATGDVVRWRDDGQLDFVGRADDQIQVRGRRVEPGEVEQVLREAPGIKEATVVVRKNPAGEMRLAAYYEAGEGERLDAEAARRHLAVRLPDYMLPGAWVEVHSWPRTAAGKLDRQRLPEPDWFAAGARVEGEAPLEGTERELAEIWRTLLALETVGRHDDFFAVGGESLKAMQMISRIRKRWPVEVGVRAIFEHRTVSKLAGFLDHQLASELEPIEEGVL